MTTEREQLELAAKACGHHVVGPVERFIVQPNTEHIGGLIIRNNQGGDSAWNPLADDGDCARMEAQLGLSILWFKDYVLSGKGRLHQVIDCEDHNGDKNAARRAASVAVASEIGKLM